jgi:hypothetical protein
MTPELVVAVTGHRALDRTDALCDAAGRARAAILAAFPNRRVVLLSALAEGAGRIALEPWFASPTTPLVALLPKPRAAYEAELESEQAREDFSRLIDRAQEVRVVAPDARGDDASATIGSALVSLADVLVAVWDGQPARGPGGTGAVVAHARDRRLPLAWVRVDPAAPRPDVMLERFPERH